MPQYAVGPVGPVVGVRLPGTDSEVPHLIYDRFVKPAIDTGFGIAPPAPSQSPSSGLDVGTAIAARSPVGLFKQLFFHGSALNGGAEVPGRSPSPYLRVAADGTVGYGSSVPEKPHVLPMWAADP